MRLNKILLAAACALLMLPVLALALAWLTPDVPGVSMAQTWWHLLGTTLPGYVSSSLWLALGVGAGAAVVGSSAALAVTLFEFPGRRALEWLLLLPLAMPAYVLAYVWTDTLQYSGPLQTALRSALGLQGALWPDVRSLGGAVAVFVLCLYPYVYLLMRAALAERGVQLMQAARLLGAGLSRRVLRVALPLARPALAAGVVLVLMETLADYGVGAYFGLNTFTTGIYRAWLALGDRSTAAQLAVLMLVCVAALVAVEKSAQRRLRFGSARSTAPGQTRTLEGARLPLRSAGARLAAWAVCGLPLLLGFVLPVAALLRLAWRQMHYNAPAVYDFATGQMVAAPAPPWWQTPYAQAAANSLTLALVAAVLALLLAWWLSFAQRGGLPWPLAVLRQTVALGYAVPGAVITVGILLPLGWWQQAWPTSPLQGLITGTLVGVVYACLVRFTSVALQSIEAGYARLPTSMDDNARLLGVRGVLLWWRVHRPLLMRASGTAALLVFVDVMKELPATLLLRPFGYDTLAVQAFQMASDERLAEAALPSLTIVLTGLLPVLLLARATR
ncbi:ABC transporter permease [Amphibiibacter pelophylacis]|uniref:Iron ABC transporter permease n=1 Tax=Amphibiibacter pelophylacis TaxID=1799477 RepID=A0ACC6NYT1_9BURK